MYIVYDRFLYQVILSTPGWWPRCITTMPMLHSISHALISVSIMEIPYHSSMPLIELNIVFSICQSKDVFIVSLLTEIKYLCVVIEINAVQKWDSRNSWMLLASTLSVKKMTLILRLNLVQNMNNWLYIRSKIMCWGQSKFWQNCFGFILCRLHPFGSWNYLRGNSSSAVTFSPCVQATCPSLSLSPGHQLVSIVGSCILCFSAEDLLVCMRSTEV